MGELIRRLDRLEQRYPARCAGCGGAGPVVILDELAHEAEPVACPSCGARPLVIEAVPPVGRSER